jgi:hypothetical protein
LIAISFKEIAMNASLTARACARLIPVAAALLALMAPAHAQSGYTVSTLSSTYPDGLDRFWLDASNRVYGNRPRFSLTGYIVAGFGGTGGTGELPRSAYWPASTSASVSPSNTFALSTYPATVAVSDNGQWQGLSSTSDGKISRAKGTSISSVSPNGSSSSGVIYVLNDINNTGDMVGYQKSTGTPYVWRAGVASEVVCNTCVPNSVLGYGSNAKVNTINNLGVMAGAGLFETSIPNDPYYRRWESRPVRWTNGAISWVGNLADFGAGADAQVVAMNDAGSMLVQQGQPGYTAVKSYLVSASGTVLPLSPNRASATAVDINASGVVVGVADGRAVMWVNGAEIDLAAHLASKGVAQANTWQWPGITDINDAGSMLVEYRENSTATIKRARLTAKP